MVLQGAALCCQAMQVVVLLWQKDGCSSQATLGLLRTILADAAGVAGHEVIWQLGVLNLVPEHSYKSARDTALASSLLSGRQAHHHCGIDQLQAQWAHQ